MTPRLTLADALRALLARRDDRPIPVAHCAICGRRYLDQRGLALHHQAQHPETYDRTEAPVTEIPTPKPRILREQQRANTYDVELPTWAVAAMLGGLFALAGVIAVVIR
jgi:dTDP-4-dehydrorhamnose reductase